MGEELSRRSFLKATAGGLVPLAFGCIPDSTGPGTFLDEAHLGVEHALPSRMPQPGASWLDVNTVARDAILYIPDGYDHAVPAPLLVTLHGRDGSAPDWEPFYPKCDLRGIVMLAIESRSLSWDRALTGNFGPDVDYIAAALRKTFGQCNTDPTAIGLAGFSDGATYALSLGLSNGDLFTHLIAFAPGFSAPGPRLRGKPRIYIAHGRSDPVFDEPYTFREIVQPLRLDDYEVQYTPFDGGHTVPAEISDAAFDWFVA